MARTARIEPFTEEREGGARVDGWKVIDISNPAGEVEISRHRTEPEALQAARVFEGSPEYTLGDQDQEGEREGTFAVRQVDAAGGGVRFEVYNSVTDESHGYFDSEQEARAEQVRLRGSTGGTA